MVATHQMLHTSQRTLCPKAFTDRRTRLRSTFAQRPDNATDGPCASGRAADSPGLASLSQDQLAQLGSASKLIAASVIVYHVAFSSSAARAGDRPWKPRRHHRRIGERFTNTWAEELVEEQEGAREKQHEAARLARLRLAEQREADQRRIREEEEAMKRRAQEILIKQHEAARSNGLPFKILLPGSSTDVAPLVVWIALGTALAVAYRSQLGEWLRSGGRRRKSAGGKWVYDRSLGGRKVWVPDSSSFGGPTSAVSLSEKAGRSLKDEEFERLASFAAAARTGGSSTSSSTSSPSGSSSLTSSSDAAATEPPAWWDPPPVLYAPAAVKAARAEEAARLLSRLESAKVSGRDYELADIRALRRACQEGHVSVKPKTVGGRDAIFRAAVEAAVAAAQSRNASSLDDASPGRWVSAVATDLGME
ncbi:hypothetical protein Agub_g10136, partial [Astrephomene gubernaculifera]